MTLPALLAELPRARYGVAVSGGADSTALLRLCSTQRPDCHLHVIHLDHQARGEESAEDARFVARLAQTLGLPCTIATRSEIEPALGDKRPANRSALYRALRHALMRQVCARHELAGVLLAHHADDQAETVLHRLLRGSGPGGLSGMSPRTVLRGGLVLLRPLLRVRSQTLRDYLRSIGQEWREDPSNQSPQYRRNVLRGVLRQHPGLTESLLALGEACAGWQRWLADNAPRLEETFGVEQLRGQLPMLAGEAGRRWLVERGAPPGALSPQVLRRFVDLVTDAASAAQAHFPGKLLVRRKHGCVSARPG